jgi:hypothetical protein
MDTHEPANPQPPGPASSQAPAMAEQSPVAPAAAQSSAETPVPSDPAAAQSGFAPPPPAGPSNTVSNSAAAPNWWRRPWVPIAAGIVGVVMLMSFGWSVGFAMGNHHAGSEMRPVNNFQKMHRFDQRQHDNYYGPRRDRPNFGPPPADRPGERKVPAPTVTPRKTG